MNCPVIHNIFEKRAMKLAIKTRKLVLPVPYRKVRIRTLFQLALFWITMLLLVPAHAQNYPNVAPHVPVPQTSGTITPPPLDEQKVAGDKVIIPHLEGLKLVDDASKVIPSGVRFAGIYDNDLPLLRSDLKLMNELNAFLGKPLTFDQINDLSKDIISSYRRNGHPLVDVLFPEQDVNSGVLQILVIEFQIGTINVTNNHWFTKNQIQSGLRLEPRDTVDFTKLQEDIDWINQNPFRSVDAVFEKGEISGTTNIDLKTQDQLPARVYASYDNTGVPTIGRSRWNLGGSWGNAFWDNQLLSYQFSSSDDFWVSHGNLLSNIHDASFTAHSIDDVIPLPWHDKIDIFGTYTSERPQLVSDFQQSGHSGQASFRYIHPLPNLSFLGQEIQLGYDHKTTNNNLEFGGEQVYTSAIDVDQFLLVYKGSQRDLYGGTTFTNSVFYSPGGLTAGNNTSAFQHSGTSYASAEYVYDNLQLSRSTPVFGYLNAVSRFSAQLSSGNLLPSEDLGLGGENSVRGYNERTINGSEGILFSQELRSPSLSISQSLFNSPIEDQAQVLTFWDFGSVADNKTQPNMPSSTQLSSVGVGMRYALGTTLSLQADYGWQLIKLPTAQDLGSLVHVMLTASY